MKKATDFKTARIYASALYESAQESGALEKVYGDFETLQEIKLSSIKEAECFSNPMVDFETKKEILEMLETKLNLGEQVFNLLKILVQNEQFKILELVLNDFMQIYNQKHKITEVVVETVKELSMSQDKMLKEKLSDLFKQDVKINYLINPKILGGLVVKNGSVLIDMSLKNQLKKIEQLMKGIN